MNGVGKDEQDRVRNLVDHAAEVTGAALAGAAGVGLGYALTGPSGAAAGAAFGGAAGSMAVQMLEDMAHGALDFTYRMLGRREKVRVGAIVVYCYEKFQENINEGRQPRQDGFFDDAPNERSADKEVFEGIMLAAQREPQEQKLRFFGNLVANIAFHSEIDRARANYLVALAENLSYRQLCLLRVFALNEARAVSLRTSDFRDELPLQDEDVVILQEIYSLYNQGLLYPGGKAVLGVINIVPANMFLQGVAATLHNLMELHRLENIDVLRLVALLQQKQ